MFSTEICFICSFLLTIGSLHIWFHCWPVTRSTSWYFPFVSLFDKNLFVEWCSSHICNKVTSSPLTHPARLCFYFTIFLFFFISNCVNKVQYIFSTHENYWSTGKCFVNLFSSICSVQHFWNISTNASFLNRFLSFDAHALHLYIILWENPSYFWKISRKASLNNIKW